MPNWVDNLVVATGAEDALTDFFKRHFREDVEGGNISFDFETVVPVPPVVQATGGMIDGELGLVALGVKIPGSGASRRKTLKDVLTERWVREAGIRSSGGLLTYLRKHQPEALEAAEKLIVCHQETGCADWYDWSVKNWGTKWSADATSIIGAEVGKLAFHFLTASRAPEPVFRALGPLHPGLAFEIAATDPDNDWAITGRVAGDVAAFEEADVSETYALIHGEMPEAA